MEAAACGTPTVASHAPGLRDSVRHGETGLLVPHGDGTALTATLARVLDDDALRESLGRGAETFARSFGWEDSATRVEAVLRRAAAGDPGGRDPGPEPLAPSRP